MITRAGKKLLQALSSEQTSSVYPNRLWSSKRGQQICRWPDEGKTVWNFYNERSSVHDWLTWLTLQTVHVGVFRCVFVSTHVYLPEPLYDRMVGAVAVLVNSVLSPVIDVHVTQTTHEQLQRQREGEHFISASAGSHTFNAANTQYEEESTWFCSYYITANFSFFIKTVMFWLREQQNHYKIDADSFSCQSKWLSD